MPRLSDVDSGVELTETVGASVDQLERTDAEVRDLAKSLAFETLRLQIAGLLFIAVGAVLVTIPDLHLNWIPGSG